MKEINDLYDYGYKIVQKSDYFKFSLDSLLLAKFVKPDYKDKKVLDALTKKATGYETKEVTEEYTNDGEKDVLTKKKICKFIHCNFIQLFIPMNF